MGNSLSFTLVHGLAIAGFVLGLSITTANAEIECKEQGDFVKELFEKGFTNISGGILRGEAAEVLPEGSTIMLMVDPITEDFHLLVTKPNVLSCRYMKGVSWKWSDK